MEIRIMIHRSLDYLLQRCHRRIAAFITLIALMSPISAHALNAYVSSCSQGGGTVSAIDTSTNMTIASIPAINCVGVAVSLDGTRAYVSIWDEVGDGDSILVIDTSTN